MTLHDLLILLLATLVGWLITYLWSLYRQSIKDRLISIDDSIELKLQNRWPNFSLSKETHLQFDLLVSTVVDWMDSFASSEAFWKKFIIFIIKQRAAFPSDMITKLKDFATMVDPNKPLLGQIPPEIQPLVNRFKEEYAKNIIQSKVALILPEAKKTEEEISAAIKGSVEANKILKEPVEITKDKLVDLLSEHK